MGFRANAKAETGDPKRREGPRENYSSSLPSSRESGQLSSKEKLEGDLPRYCLPARKRTGSLEPPKRTRKRTESGNPQHGIGQEGVPVSRSPRQEGEENAEVGCRDDNLQGGAMLRL